MKSIKLSIGLILITALIVMTGCSDNSKSNGEKAAAGSEVTEQDRYGGTVAVGIGVPIVSDLLDPHRSASPGNSRVQRSLFDSLVVELPDNQFGPWLATKWDISADNLTYTFYLRDDVTFTDGTKLDAAAVKFNFDRIKTLESPGLALNYIGSLENTEVVDDYTVRFHFAKPFAPFLRYLATENLGIVSPKAVADRGEEFTVNPVGSGPFYIDSYKLGNEYVLKRNPNYNWGPSNAKHTGKAYLDTLHFKIITEEASRVSALQSGDVQVIDTIPPQSLEQIKQSYQLQQVELLNYNASIHFNATKGVLQDKRLREALRLSVDWDRIVKTIYLGTYDRAYSVLSPSLFGYDTSLKDKWEKPDTAKAEALLDEAGWVKGADGIRVKDGNRLTLQMIDFYANREKRMDVMTMVQNIWKTIGVELNISTTAVGDYTEKSKSGDFDLWIGSQYGPDPDGVLRPYLLTRTGYHDRIQNPKIGELLDQATVEMDVEKRAQLYKEVQNIVQDEVYAIPVYVLPYTVASAKQVQDIGFDSKGAPQFYDTWIQK
ncbi:peptide/nickel transport system substrate-binding protein [Paenibacillus cellulosilyticus]|uniref:Peptide/nickel transport system substrate-binding protein n=1 Tax=Paenibacillus cellulosilyticus TaxID=375489 RepID=A0A2V2YUT7_9BACL|nr:ABC transporter substrate-binding protein [Paenibacillus cellulosilyticus]PWW02782.1 peptide/nickel transport system substrate-binding protein [Paenibacillus cellulosilyticus]QKS45705.1 ABC transporter substrate-binding protein [Paenibacillus cellulosilyticus]